jgi:hypothetical protein
VKDLGFDSKKEGSDQKRRQRCGRAFVVVVIFPYRGLEI